MRKYDSYALMCEVRRLRELESAPSQRVHEWGESDWVRGPDGKAVRCECGMNVFRRSTIVTNRYKCNACGQTYIGEKAQ